MGISFFETMTGELTDSAGVPHHVAIDIRCDAPRAGRFLFDGLARVTGTIRALPWAEGAACEGTVVVRPLVGSRIEYDLSFTDPEGRPCRLWGRKDINLMRHPYKSMTTMRARLECQGRELATGEMNFHADDALAFARSWSFGSTAGLGPTGPGSRTRPKAPDTGAGPRTDPDGSNDHPFTEAERAILVAFAEALIEPGDTVPPVDPSIAADVAEILPYLPPLATGLYRTGLRALDTAARSRYGRGFARLDVDRRRRLLDGIDSLGTRLGRTSLFTLGIPIRMAHFSRRDFLDRLGLPDYSNPVVEPEPRWTREITTPDDLPATSRIECDVVVIGTGAGGAAVAASLAEQGYAVVMVEEGPYVGRSQFSGPLDRRILRQWRDGAMSVAVGNTPLSVPSGRVVGGTTTINSGTCFRTPDAILGEWLAAGFPSDFEPDRFAHWLDRVETELQVTPGDPRFLGRIAEVVAKGAADLGGHHGALRRNAPACDGQGVCVTGCPTGAKLSAERTWIPRAVRAGAQVFAGMPATRILTTGRRAVGALLEGQDDRGAPRRVEVQARAVVVSAGSLMTPLLLRRNGVSLPQLGRNLSIHPATGALAMFDHDLSEPWRAIPQGYFVEGLADELIRYEGYYSPPQMYAPVTRMRGPELTRWMDSWSRVGQFGFMTRDTGVGTVTAGPHGRPLIRYSLTPRVVRAMRSGHAVLAEMLLRGGATEVFTTIGGVEPITDIYQARAIAERKLRPEQLATMGFHPLGTARMGNSPDTAVVDFENRVHGWEGLYVADGSCVPTSLGVNPMITIMALALRAGAAIGSHLG